MSIASESTKADTLEYVITHIFCPIKPPQHTDYTLEKDHSLLDVVLGSAHKFASSFPGDEEEQWSPLLKMLESLAVSITSSSMAKDVFESQIRSMQAHQQNLMQASQQRGKIPPLESSNSKLQSRRARSGQESTLSQREAQAAELLATLWTINNTAARECWADQLEEAARDAEELRPEEQEAARKEEQKKNKSKFVPVGNAKVPSVPVVIPSHYAVCKLKAGEYCELYYFTNKGLKEAKKNLLSTEAPRLTLMTNAEGQQTWVNADETRDPKAVFTKDENLSWEHFNEAAPRMITAMKQHEWPEDRVTQAIVLYRCIYTGLCWSLDADANAGVECLEYEIVYSIVGFPIPSFPSPLSGI
ncbi:hypothetical protein DEU56DRAFT_951233 [Suillus clintonianus]|uniref:uncharacterized protein n=1 Tax=Suillus clintonianus TaxID=1904413 RepID=UPI001B8638AD|nr:uncharacterized protein DEU56DRAFT_951233 [Suillus clintonianus]KAG2153842.1 hypothetical protein DEU56DRAFT_951233 [Suillus clintonianus]